MLLYRLLKAYAGILTLKTYKTNLMPFSAPQRGIVEKLRKRILQARPGWL
jgi:hypothetical protein